MEPHIINTLSTDPDIKYFREKKVTIKYNYKDINGNYLMSIIITPDKYTGKAPTGSSFNVQKYLIDFSEANDS